MLKMIVTKELREVARDRRLCLSLAVIPLLLAVTLAVSWREEGLLGRAQRHAQQAARENWLNQGSRNPHGAAHHGTFLFKPASPLSFFDPGLDPFLGTTVRVEAHHRHRAANLPAADSADPVRFDASSAALLLQVVLPLVVILLGFSRVSGERETGTLPMLLSLGVPPWKLLLGKAISVLLITASLVSPVVVFFAWALASGSHAASRADASMRTSLLATCYASYLAGWAFLTLAVSARSSSSRPALVILVALWATSTVIVPRVANDAAARLYPLPTQEEYERKVTAAIRSGPDGKTSIYELHKKWEADLLEKYGVSKKEDLPINADGVLMQLGEEHADRFHDEADASLGAVFARQDRLVGWCALASPYLAVRTASMTLAGTDRAHHEHFGRAAEAYRRGLVRALNEADARRAPGGRGSGRESGRELWETMDDFRYDPPGWGWASGTAVPRLGLLAGWLILSAALAVSARPRPHGVA